MEEKKKRGSNYTLAEKRILLELIKKYQNIIENKETNANMILKKRETWDFVCQQYNAVAVSGLRTLQQLRHLYENLKQRSKKNIAENNRLKFYEKPDVVKKKATVDKKEINRTGGGAYKSILTEQDTQILAMVAPQVTPLPNPYDDAAVYFGDKEVINDNRESEFGGPSDVILMHTDTDSIDNQHTTMTDRSLPGNYKSCIITSNITDDPGPAKSTYTVDCNKPGMLTSNLSERVKLKKGDSNIKQEYYKVKLRNAKLEHKYLINRNKMEINKYKLETEILKLRLKKLKSSKNN